MGNAKIVAVDFDGTLCAEAYPAIGAPKTDVIDLIKKIKAAGNIIILNTCRVGERLTEAVDWCKSHELEFDYINENAPQRIEQYGSDTRKISADVYIDDRAFDITQVGAIATKAVKTFLDVIAPLLGLFLSADATTNEEAQNVKV